MIKTVCPIWNNKKKINLGSVKPQFQGRFAKVLLYLDLESFMIQTFVNKMFFYRLSKNMPHSVIVVVMQ